MKFSRFIQTVMTNPVDVFGQDWDSGTVMDT
jgi:hypothetical protein